MMITTSSFPNVVTSSENEDIQKNSLTKEDLEGKVKKNISSFPQNINKEINSNINGGTCQNIDI